MEDIYFLGEDVHVVSELGVLFLSDAIFEVDALNRIIRGAGFLTVEEMLVDVTVLAEGTLSVESWMTPPAVTSPRLQRGVRGIVETG